MKLPRLILNPSVTVWIRWWQQERRENQRLRRELRAWQDRVLESGKLRPLFTPPPPPVEVAPRPPIGLIEKRQRQIKREQGHVNHPSAEEVFGLQ
jgi:hypothetical protein